MRKTYKSKVKIEYFSSIAIFIILVLFMYFLDELSIKSFFIFLAIAIVISRISIDETLYLIKVDDKGINVIKNRFPASEYKFDVMFKDITKIDVKHGGSGSYAKIFKLFCTSGVVKHFKLVNYPEIIDELVEIFKERDIIINDKRR